MDLDIFHFDEERKNFEDFSQENSFRYWSARFLMKVLGYESYTTFKNIINKALTSCMTSGIETAVNFQQDKIVIDGKTVDDYRLSKFACYLVTMNGDPKKPSVARAQAYFITMTEAFQRYIREVEDIERVPIRDEISEHEKSLSSTAKQAGVIHYALFQNSGYLGMYNMNLMRLKQKKGIPSKRTPLDFMGKEELAANLFRITQTEAKIKKEGIRGQDLCENAALQVGKKVRKTMQDISGNKPEDLPVAQDIKKVKSELKRPIESLKNHESLVSHE